jgi:glutaminase
VPDTRQHRTFHQGRRACSPDALQDLNIPAVLATIAEEVQPCFGKGRQATYIPALAEVDPRQFGMAITTVTGEEYAVGDAGIPFSIQSISKVFTLILALNVEGEQLWSRIGREPSGSAFNSLVQLEYEKGIPRNPFINAGAIVAVDRVYTHVDDFKKLFLDFIRFLCASERVDYDPEVMASEQATGNTNYALAHLLKAYGTIETAVDVLLPAYFYQCSISMTCTELARTFVGLANQGMSPVIRESVVTERRARRINSLMLTCGMYDAVGNFAYRVGLPSKSGVGGGVVAIVPGVMAITVWSPELDLSGNSVAGVRALELFTEITGLSVF